MAVSVQPRRLKQETVTSDAERSASALSMDLAGTKDYETTVSVVLHCLHGRRRVQSIWFVHPLMIE